VIVDFTAQRPNVYLEFGMAIVLGKPIIAITQKQEDCPSDVRNIKYIVYPIDHADAVLKAELPKALRDTIEQVEALAQRRSR
jgi:predicted nucleotide-binding protein